VAASFFEESGRAAEVGGVLVGPISFALLCLVHARRSWSYALLGRLVLLATAIGLMGSLFAILYVGFAYLER
jgi:hypothetical protein